MKLKLTNFRPLVRTENIVQQEAGDDLLLYDLSTNKAYSLNKTSANIYQYCNGSNNIGQLGDLTGFDRELIMLTLESFKKENLLNQPNEISNHFDAISRRRLIRRIGINSIAALPLITSIAAPKSTRAASAGCGIQNPPSSPPCQPIDCFSSCNGGEFSIVIVNGCRTCNCLC